MTTAESKKVVGYLVASAPGNSFTPETVGVYADQLRDLDYAVTTRVVRTLVGTMRFLPKPSEIRDAVLIEVHRLPDVGVAIHEISVARTRGRVEDADWSHPLIRVAIEEVTPRRIHDEWSYSHREVGEVYSRLRAEFLRALNEAGLNGHPPRLPPALLAISAGIDPFAPPPHPSLAANESFGGWSRDHTRGEWFGLIRGPNAPRLETRKIDGESRPSAVGSLLPPELPQVTP